MATAEATAEGLRFRQQQLATALLQEAKVLLATLVMKVRISEELTHEVVSGAKRNGQNRDAEHSMFSWCWVVTPSSDRSFA